MQGIQSSTIPEKSEKRGLSFGTGGPLEAAKRYLDRQRENEAALAAIDDEEDSNGRPAWLRRWQGETPHQVAATASTRTVVAGGAVNSLLSTAREETQTTPNGYNGQSIEAAFTYETVFQFETDLEAQETEDWLDLSGQRRQGAQDVEDTKDESRQSPAPDPQSVRAAIFRLSQEPPNRHTSSSSPAENSTRADIAAQIYLEGLAGSDSGIAGSISAEPGADFAEVAHQIWSQSGSIEADGRGPALETSFIAAGTAADTLSVASKSEAMNAPLLPAESPQTGPAEWNGMAIGQLAAANVQPDLQSGPEPQPEWTLHQALSEIRNEIRQSAQATQPERNMTPPATEVNQARVTASGAPALAHDASNLLSALKLYSELLALSGVLQARHSHYAQDLKLLAARSEVLIGRLLTACTLAEHEARHLIGEQIEEQSEEQSARQADNRAHSLGFQSSVRVAPAVSDLLRDAEPVVPTAKGDHAQDEVAARVAQKEDASQTCQELPPSHTSESVPAEPAASPELQQPIVGQNGASATFVDDEAGAAGEQLNNIRSAEVSDCDTVGPINLVDLLTRWGSLLSMIARGRVEVKFGPQAALPIQVGEEAMERILVNLVHNAMTATKNGGAIRIGVGRAERSRHSTESGNGLSNRMVLTVDDSGCGMSEDQVARVLGMEQARVGASRAVPFADHRRHGMGLQIVRELVSASGGELAIYSRCGVGTRIEIRWPILQDEGATAGRIPPASVGIDAALSGRLIHERPIHERRVGGERGPLQAGQNSERAVDGYAGSRSRQGLEGAMAC